MSSQPTKRTTCKLQGQRSISRFRVGK
jgi:hypothetical protein